jgi:hypothetical protein
MAHSDTLDEQTQALQTGLHTLARQLAPAVLQALREASTDLAMANDRKLLFVVSEAVQAHRHAFEASFEQSICAAPTPEPTEPRPVKASAFGELDLDALGLVDEAQADREIEVSRTV